MAHFLASITLATPFIPGKRLNLDSLLAGIIYERTANVDQALNDIPLRRTDAVWEGSACFFETPVFLSDYTSIGGLRPATMNASVLAMKTRKRDGVKKESYPRIDLARGPHQNRLSRYKTVTASRIHFLGTGDLSGVGDLLKDVRFIGTKRSAGFGQVKAIDLVEFECSSAHPALVLPDNTPARPIPLEQFRSLSNGACLEGYERVRPPYFEGDFVLCALPTWNEIAEGDLEGKLVSSS